jgi:enoyl-CoA hydratase
MSSESRAVVLELEGPVAYLTLNRPRVLNAMNLQWVTDLDAAVTCVAQTASVRVVVVRGRGRAFCAGLDLDMLARERMPPGFYDTQERAFHRLESLDAISVAAMHGYCLGGGLQLALACDIRVCSDDCRLGLPAVNEGLFPALATFRLPRLVGLAAARRLILSGDTLASDEARRLNLVDYVVPAGTFEAGVKEIVEKFLRTPAAAARASKHLMARTFDLELSAAFEQSVGLMSRCLESVEVARAADAWIQRRAQRKDGTTEDEVQARPGPSSAP